jgi:NADH-quinone oxidoreductase subunit M
MEITNNWILPALILVPFIAGFACWLVDKLDKHLPRYIALVGMLITLGLTVILWKQGGFDYALGGQAPTWAAEFYVPWIKTLGINIHLAVDGLSLLMVGLTALLGVLAVGCSWGEIQKNVGFFHLNLLWSLGGVIGVFLAIDMFLFFFFWEMMLVPIYFLIALWGHKGADGKSRVYAATKFFIYTQVAGLIMLVGILGLVIIGYNTDGRIGFGYTHLMSVANALDANPSTAGYAYALMICLFIGFAVKLPVFPLHGWLPDAHAQAPTAGSVDLAGILIKTAAYGLLRFVMPFFPAASAQFADIAIIFGLIGIFYGAWCAFQQTDMKRLLAYTSISHMGFVLLALYAGNILTFQGLMIMMLAHGLSSAALFIMCGQVYERLHTRDLRLR